MALSTISGIRNAVGVGARPNLFRVSFGSGFVAASTSNFSLLVKASALPGSTVGVIEVPMGGGRRYKVAGDRTYAEWTTTVLNDAEYSARRAIEEYQNSFVFANYEATVVGSSQQRTGSFASENKLAVVTVEQLDQANAVKKSYQLQNCFVSDISTIDLSYDSTDAVEEFTVTWVFDYFTVS
jgi:hypothetical protein